MKRLLGLLVLGGLCLGLSQTAVANQFKHAVFYKTNELPRRVLAVDLRNNGILDLVIADYLSDRVSILFGNGDGTFQKPKGFIVSAPIGIASGDFNGDGKVDLALIESGGTGQSAIAIFLNDGTGIFHEASHYDCGIYSISLAVGDFDGDGNLDVAVANRGFNRPGNVKVFFGNGKGQLGKPTTYAVSGGPYGIAVGDLNGDGHLDIATALDLGGSVAVLLNDGTGHFKKPVSYNAGGGEAVDVKIADLRRDGRNDLVIANLSQGMVVLLNKGNGTFGKPAIYQPTFQNWQPPEACTVADFNLDGKLDVACAPHLLDAYIFYGKGDGTFKTGIEINDTIQNQGGFSIASGDFNRDGAPDLAIPIEEYGKVAILLNTQ